MERNILTDPGLLFIAIITIIIVIITITTITNRPFIKRTVLQLKEGRKLVRVVLCFRVWVSSDSSYRFSFFFFLKNIMGPNQYFYIG